MIIMSDDSYEKIDEGIATDGFDDLLSRIVDYSQLDEPDIKKRLSLEKELSKYLNSTSKTAFLVLNFILEIISHGHRTKEKRYSEST